jgi:hypothetical protein
VLDGPNEYVADHAAEYGPNGYLRLALRGRTLSEVVLSSNGVELWREVLVGGGASGGWCARRS